MWDIIEYAATILECLICADFAVRFLTPKNERYKIFCYLSIVLSDVLITITLNSIVVFEGTLGFLRILVNFLIILIFMKGTVFEKLLFSILIDTSLLIISFLSLNILSLIFGIPAADLIVSVGAVRLIILFVTKFAFFILRD